MSGGVGLADAWPSSGLGTRVFFFGLKADRAKVLVFGRRSYARFSLEPSGDGVLRVLRDVVVQHVGSDELLVIGREAAAVGSLLTLELPELDAGRGIGVRVVDSGPVVIDGAIRHRLRLQRVGP